jgi:hypothetical protein
MKIFSMSVFGNHPQYVEGAKKQTALAEQYFPGWQVRIYTDNPANFTDIDTRAQIISVTDGSYGVFWRFAPLFESPDNIVVIRDSDSRITVREQLAVNEWVSSDCDFHVIKDHEAHYHWAVNAGMFACKGQLTAEMHQSMLSYQHGAHTYTIDQIWLQNYVWPERQKTAMIHSMTDSGWFRDTRTMLVNPYDFIGNGYTEHDMPLYPQKLTHGWTSADAEPQDRFNHGVLK